VNVTLLAFAAVRHAAGRPPLSINISCSAANPLRQLVAGGQMMGQTADSFIDIFPHTVRALSAGKREIDDVRNF